ncbi:zinc finger protein 343 isoform X1 [Canis lupus dingo]|uniref:zinc finger protein 343 isoform X1 n=1 Tax=Canis lupus dingo TaxID=286419 RepID=UPI0020C50708|nr:zinc finger protein 343 isoform X1 [Canis lupus dingo]
MRPANEERPPWPQREAVPAGILGSVVLARTRPGQGPTGRIPPAARSESSSGPRPLGVFPGGLEGWAEGRPGVRDPARVRQVCLLQLLTGSKKRKASPKCWYRLHSGMWLWSSRMQNGRD